MPFGGAAGTGGEGGLEGLSRDGPFQLRPLQPHPLGKGSGMGEDGSIHGKRLSPEQGLPPPSSSLFSSQSKTVPYSGFSSTFSAFSSKAAQVFFCLFAFYVQQRCRFPSRSCGWPLLTTLTAP